MTSCLNGSVIQIFYEGSYMRIIQVVILLFVLFLSKNSIASDWSHHSGTDDNYIFTKPINHSAPVSPHLVIWCGSEGFDVSLTAHELVGNGKDVRVMTNMKFDNVIVKATWGISTTNKALYIERIQNTKVAPMEFIVRLFKHNTISIDYGAIDGGKFVKRSATFSMSGARDLFKTACKS